MMHILIVEDTEDSRCMLQEFFLALGEQVSCACDGEEALDKIRTCQPDIIISDILMPRMDGYVLCREVKSNPAWKHIPFIFYTATYTGERDKELALDLGAEYFLVKPEMPGKLHEAVKRVLDGYTMRPTISREPPEIDEKHYKVVSAKLDKKILELEAERELLHKKEAELNLIMNALPILVSHVDRQMRYRYVNKAYEQWHDLKRSQIVGRKVEDVVGEGVWPAIEPYIKRALAGETVEYETDATFRNGETRKIWAKYLTSVNETGHADGFIALVTDISERVRAEEEKKQLQQQLLQAQKMEAIGQLAGGIAHDFNNILMVMNGYTDLVHRDLKNRDEKNANYLREVLEGGDRAKDLVSQLLTFSRGSIQDTHLVNIKSAIQDSLRLIAKLIPASVSIEFIVPAQDYKVDINSIQFQQVLMNLCINARDAMGGQGKVTIESLLWQRKNMVCSSCHRKVNGEFLAICVQDTGEGIPQDRLASIFQPFYTTKEDGQGTGMGLAVAHGIVHDHGGHIVVESSSAGSTFSLLFPLAHGEIEASPEMEDIPAHLRADAANACKILVLDDEISIGNYLQLFLSMHGYDVDVFNHPTKALENVICQPDKYDLILTDYTMPEMTGLEFIEKVKQVNKNVPVLLFTGFSDRISETQAKNAGVDTCFIKPIASTSLLEKIGQLLPRSVETT